VLGPLRERTLALGKTVRLEHRIGQAADGIAAAAAAGQFDLLVMGSHGHSPIGALMLGSTTARVLAHCHTPLLIVR
jgi:nucleotide-binding universal stress UspA family protein